MLLLILSVFKRINYFQFLLKSSEKRKFSDNLGGIKLIYLNFLDIRTEI